MVRWKRIAEETGVEIAEAALVMPIFFMILLGIYWFGMAFNTYATINRAAMAGARYAIAQSCATCGNTQQSAANIAGQVTQVMQASNVNPNAITTYAPASPTFCTGTATTNCNNANSNITVCSNVQLSPAASPGVPSCGVTVSFRYPYQFYLPFSSLNMQKITLTANAQMRSEF
jgi:Flp pilus assembly protein TadG